MNFCLKFLIFILATCALLASDSLRLIYPNGGEKFDFKDNIDIQWTGVPSNQPVDIYFSKNAGKNWNRVATGKIGNSWWYNAPDTASNECLVKLEAELGDNQKRVLSQIIELGGYALLGFEVSKNGKYLIYRDGGTLNYLRNLETNTLISFNNIGPIKFSSDSKYLLIADKNILKRYNIVDQEYEKAYSAPSESSDISAITISDDNNLIAIGNNDGNVIIFDFLSGTLIKTIPAYYKQFTNDFVAFLEIGMDNKFIFITQRGNFAPKLYDISSAELKKSFGYSTCLFTPDKMNLCNIQYSEEPRLIFYDNELNPIDTLKFPKLKNGDDFEACFLDSNAIGFLIMEKIDSKVTHSKFFEYKISSKSSELIYQDTLYSLANSYHQYFYKHNDVYYFGSKYHIANYNKDKMTRRIIAWRRSYLGIKSSKKDYFFQATEYTYSLHSTKSIDLQRLKIGNVALSEFWVIKSYVYDDVYDLIYFNFNNAIYSMNPNTLEIVKSFPDFNLFGTPTFYGLAVSNDGKKLAISYDLGSRNQRPEYLIRIYDLEKGEFTHKFLQNVWPQQYANSNNHYGSLAFSSDDKKIAINYSSRLSNGAVEDMIRVFDIENNKELLKFNNKDVSYGEEINFFVSFVEDDKSIIVNNAGKVQKIDIEKGTAEILPLTMVFGISSDKTLLAGNVENFNRGQESSFYVYDLKKRRRTRLTFTVNYADGPFSAAFSKDNKVLVLKAVPNIIYFNLETNTVTYSDISDSTFSIDDFTSVNEITSYETDLIYPNPTNDFIKIKDYSGTVKITNTLGTVVWEGNINCDEAIKINHLPSGIYIINYGTESRKLVKQ